MRNRCDSDGPNLALPLHRIWRPRVDGRELRECSGCGGDSTVVVDMRYSTD